MAGPNFKDLPTVAQEALRDLDHQGASLLAIGAIRARNLERERSFPVDPVEAVREARAVSHAKVVVEIDDPVGLAIDSLEVATAALSRGAFDDHDADALVNLLSLVDNALRQYRTNSTEADNRLRAIAHPEK